MKRADTLLLVVESSLYPSLSPSLDAYVRDLREEGCTAHLALWDGGGAQDLRGLLRSSAEEVGIDGAFFVGNLPTAWYEQSGFTGHEEFPCDLFFMDLDAPWEDGDSDGIFDSHSALNLDIFVSRIEGTGAEIVKYFDKVRRYRAKELSVWKGAYIFKDDDWVDFHRGSSFELSCIYRDIDICEDLPESVRSAYVAKLTHSGAEYVYQWIHAYPSLLCIRGSTSYEYIHVNDVENNNFKGMFYNLFNCSATRFTEENLGSAYLMRTDFGIAALGSTKVGGNYYPRVFHYVLSRGGRWGDAYKAWYNAYGVTNDKWFLGMVILGDPMLALSGETQKELKPRAVEAFPPRLEEIEALEEVFRRFGHENIVLNFEEYRSLNPQFFE